MGARGFHYCCPRRSWAASRAGRRRFISGKARANTVKALVITDAEGRLMFCGQPRPGPIHDTSQLYRPEPLST